MKYIIMECHLSYAIALDEEGRYLKVANMNYEVGQTVTKVIEMQEALAEEQASKKSHKWIYSFVAMAACLVLIATSVLQMGQIPYASVYMTINPEVRIDVNRKDVVVGVEGTNEDGRELVEGYSYKKKSLDRVMDELVDLAIEMGYLSEGGMVTLTLDAEDDEWVVSTGEELQGHLNEYLSDKLSITVEVSKKVPEKQEITIPLDPEDEGASYGDSAYGDTNSSNESTGDDGDSGYDDNQVDDEDSGYDGQTDYGTTEDDGQSSYDEPSDDGQSSYDTTDDDSGQSNYDESADDGQSGYDESADDGQSSYDTTDDDSGQSNYDESANDGQSSYDETDYGQSSYDTSDDEEDD